MIGDPFRGDFYPFERLEGGMGYVYLGFSTVTGRYQAAKTFKDEALLNRDGSVNTMLADRFRKEALAWLSLGEHPNIARADLVLEYEGRPYLFLEFVVGHEGRGATLESWLDRTREDIPFALDLAVQCCEGMAHASRKAGLVHRDLKPSNIMVARGGVAKITDFGLAKALGAAPDALGRPGPEGRPARGPSGAATSAGSIFGTMSYMSPEQWRDASSADERSDIYSFGAVLHEMLSGFPPFPIPPELEEAPYAAVAYHLQEAHERSAPPALSSLNPRVAGALESLVLSCLAKDPSDRPRSFADLGAALRDAYESAAGRPYEDKPRLRDFWANFEMGQEFLKKGEYAEALPCFENLARADARFFHAYQGMAQCHMGLQDYASMRADLERCLSICPDYPPARNDLGFALHLEGNDEAALAEYRRALEKGQGEAMILNNLGLSLMCLGRLGEAKEALDRSLELNPAYPDALENRAWIAQREGDSLAAAGWLRSSLSLRPGNLAPMHNLMTCLSAAGAHDAASAIADFLDEAAPGNRGTRAIREAADQAAARGSASVDFDLSCLELEGEVSLAPNAGLYFPSGAAGQDPFVLKAVSWHEMGDFARAAEACRAAIDRDPAEAGAWSVLASALRGLGEAEASREAADRALELDPGQDLALRTRAFLASDSGDYDDALRDIDAAIALHRDASRRGRGGAGHDLSSDLNNKGNILHGMGRYGEAIAAYRESLAGEPRNHLAWENLAVCLRDDGRPEEALAAVERAAGIQPRSPTLWRVRGDAQDALGDYEAAIRSLDAAIALDPARSDFRLNKGRTQYNMGDLEGARRSFEEALELEPGYELASRNLAIVEAELRGRRKGAS